MTRWENVLEAVQKRLDENPQAMRIHREPAEQVLLCAPIPDVTPPVRMLGQGHVHLAERKLYPSHASFQFA